MRAPSALLLGLVFLLPAAARAQVNTEKLRSWEKPGLGASVDLAITYQSGNVDLLQVGASTRAQWARLKAKTSSTAKDELEDLIYFVGDLTIGIRSKETFKNTGFGHARWTHMWRSWFGSEVFAQTQYNEFISLQQRYLIGAGGRIELLGGDHGEVVVGSGYMLEFEQYDVPEDGPDAREVLAHRWTSYLALKGYLHDPEVSVVNTVYVQPRLTDMGDYRVLDEAELAVEITDMLSLVAGLYLRYDSEPVAGIEKLDVTMQHKLRVVF